MKLKRVFLGFLLTFALLAPILLVATNALARAGGGEGFGGGGGGGGGGDGGGGLLYLLWLLLDLCINAPVIGIPLVICILGFIVYSGYHVNNTLQGSVLQRGGRAMSALSKTQAVAQIRQHDPAFDEMAFYQRIRNAFMKIQSAWMAQDLKAVHPFISDRISERFSLQFTEQRDAGYRDFLGEIAIRSTEIVDIVSTGVFDSIAVMISAEAADYRISLANGKYVSGNRAVAPFVEVWWFLRKRGAITQPNRSGLIEGNCPNCGAAIEMNETAICTHCKAALISGEFDWILAEIEQESEWRSRSTASIPGLEKLRQQDPGFDRVSLEDRVSVMFWRKAAADRTGKIEPLRKIASEDLCRKYAVSLRPDASQPNGTRAFAGECAVGSVAMIGFIPAVNPSEMEQALVEVNWSGKTWRIDAARHIAPFGDSNIVRHTLFVVGRVAGMQSDSSKSISSAHCPQCGAPESGGVTNACEFCGAVLNDGKHGWILLDMLPVLDPQAAKLISMAQMEDTSGSAANSAIGDANSIAATDSPPSFSNAGALAWAVKLAVVDGNIPEAERRALNDFATNRGMSPTRLEQLIGAAQSGQLEVPAPADQAEGRQWLSDMATIALADGVLTREEYSLLNTMGTRIGLGEADVKLLINRARSQQFAAARSALAEARGQGLRF
jgi:uncharacterized tellurite resistance protein B-like protein